MTASHNLSLGILGEDYAENYLKSQGYKIIERNFRKPQGDIDIVAFDNQTLAFIEVKTRISGEYGTPEEAITPRKLHMLTRSVQYYQLLHPEYKCPLRIDVVSILLNTDHSLKTLKLFKNVTG